MDCSNCNFKQSHFINAVREVKPNTNLLFFVDDEEYDMDTLMTYHKFLSDALPDNGIIFIPASMIKGIKEETCN